MLYQFLEVNSAELIERCRGKVAQRPAPAPTAAEMEHGIPMFLGQLIDTLRAAQLKPLPAMLSPEAVDRAIPVEIASSATRHGGELLRRGFTVDQVVRDYGDLCQAVTELAMEQKAPIDADEFRILNRCLDDAIAEAVLEFGLQRDQIMAQISTRVMSERLGFLAHELRNLLNTAVLSFAVMRAGTVGTNGPTAAVLERSLKGLGDLIDRALVDVRLGVGMPANLDYVSIDRLMAEVQVTSSLEAQARHCRFTVLPVDPGLAVRVDRPMLLSAVSNLLQNAFKFTRPQSLVSLRSYGEGDHVLIEVQDECGGLAPGKATAMFEMFSQHDGDRSGMGLGLSISRRAVEASGGKLSVLNLPGTGCVFRIDLPRVQDRRDDAVDALGAIAQAPPKPA